MAVRRILAAVVLCVVGSTISHALSKEDVLLVNTSTHRIVDGLGRERYFHGLNVVVKGPPWLPRTDKFDPEWSFVEKDMETLQELGLNAIRLGMMWPGAEPERGQFNETYFTTAKALVETSGKYGIYSLLDMHQDVLSGKFCGEGAPDWAVDTGTAKGFPWPLDNPYPLDPKTGYPSEQDCSKHSWPLGYITAANSAAFQNIYNNSNGLLDSLAGFWGKVAQEFADSPYILGYEIINEPWAGDFYADWELMLPTVADKRNLALVYDVVSAEIRKHDKLHSIYFESVTWDELSVGFDHVPGGPDYSNRSVLSWHFYIPPNVSPAISFPEREKDTQRLHCAGTRLVKMLDYYGNSLVYTAFVTEFSINGDQKTLIETMDEADKYLQSWLGWAYKGYLKITGWGTVWLPNGTLNMELVSVLSRTYAPVVAGVTQVMSYSQTTKEFSLRYHTTAACSSTTTEVYLNEAVHYSNGYNVSLVPSSAATWKSPKPNQILITHDTGLPEGTVIQLTLTPK